MKKVLIAILLFWEIIFVFPENIFAMCETNRDSFGNCSGGKVDCQTVPSSREIICCDNASECPPKSTATKTKTCDLCGKCPGGPDPLFYNECKVCIQDGQHAYTALGCIPTTPSGFITWFLPSIMGIAGGLAFLLILYGGFQILTSTGNPEKLNEGKEIIVSAISGLLMIIFSIIILRTIGVDILKIPGFGK